MTNQDALRCLRWSRPHLHAAGLCAAWIPGKAAVCELPRGHTGPCGVKP